MPLQIILMSILALTFAYATPQFHETLPAEDLKHYFGTAAKEDVPEYEIVHPVHLSGSRHRRSHTSPKPPLEYHVTALGEQYQLKLHHNEALLAPGCLVTTLGGDEKTVPCPIREHDCYYHGVSGNHANSTVAVSTCEGLHGLITTPSHELVIQPIREKHLLGQPVNQQTPPHIVYRTVARRKRSCSLQASADKMINTAIRRMRRGAGNKYIEMLLVGDKTMYRYHKDDLKHYMLTAANVAASRLLDTSLGVQLRLTIIRVKILTDDQPGLSIVPDADKTLSNFCTWQEKLNPEDDSDAQHVDAASLLTKVDLVHMGVKSTTGLATLGGMCSKNIRCSVVEDDGLDLGLTLAHETGHSLNLHHDGEGNACNDHTNIMSTGGGGGPTAFKWSSCSKDYLNNFIGSGKGNCLNDSPKGLTEKIPKDLPGVIYPGEDQCRFFAGEGSSLCTGTSLVDEFGGDECSKLICYDPNMPGQCKGSQIPRMDGTECGHRKWCQSGVCTDIGPNGPKAQDGGWSEYSASWTPCSRTCGGGVRYKSRKCNSPRPLFGGKDCVGSDISAEMCNVQDCATSQHNHKMEQCADTDTTPYLGQNLHWIPQDTADETQCQLYCRPEGQGTVMMRSLDGSQNYKDGTECMAGTGTFGRCIGGTCRAFGCDGVSDSGRESDKCGVCSGNGDTCSKQQGKFNKGEGKKYVSFKKLSKGSSGIVFTNKNRYSVLSLSVGGTRLVNKQDGQRDRSGTYSAGGVTVKYRPYPEKLEVLGVLAVDAEAEVYRIYGEGYDGAAPDISYEFFVPVVNNGPKKFVWKTTNGACSVTCGEGTLSTEAKCTKSDTGAAVEGYFCNLADKPSSVGKPCHKPACPASWRAGSFSECSKSCEGGVQTRAVECVRKGQEVNENACKGQKPSTSQQCNTGACPGEWQTLEWTQCSKTCSRGVQTRGVKCHLAGKVVADSKCQVSDKPATSQSCLTAVCDTDITGDKCADTADCAGYDSSVCAEYADWAQTNCMAKCGYCQKSGAKTTSSGGSCTDKAKDCDTYGKSACTSYPEWAKENCQSYCNICPGSGSQEKCADADPATCKQYGTDACTQYPDWAKTNCAGMCNMCDNPTATTAATATGGSDCKDVDSTCKVRGASVCTEYAEWAQQNCASFCNMCSASGTKTAVTGKSSGSDCKDVDSTCKDRGASICTEYAEWAQQNCAKKCGFCPGKEGSNLASTSTAQPSTTKVAAANSDCQDKAGCAGYDSSVCTQYTEWAKLNCKQLCGFCSEIAATSATTLRTTTSKPVETTEVDPTCFDVRADCQGYGKSACTQYAEWATQNCNKFCGFCQSGIKVVSASTSTSIPTTSKVTTTTTKATTTQKTTTTKTATVSTECTDIADCGAYGETVCKEYQDWAVINCKKSCGHCQETVKEESKQTTTQTTEVDSNCKDVQAKCEGYGTSVCKDYASWAKQNCQKYCGFCHEGEVRQETSSTTTTTTSKKTAATTTTLSVIDTSCTDVLTTCEAYGKSACTEYGDWAKQNCKKFCGFCEHLEVTEPASTAARATEEPKSDDNCKDVRGDCEGYGQSACTEYADWANLNCKKFCGFCGEVKTTETTVTDSNCKDEQANCKDYGEDTCAKYPEWAATKCKKYCNKCDISAGGSETATEGTENSACVDASSDCDGYGASVCTDYKDWAKINCQKKCNFC